MIIEATHTTKKSMEIKLPFFRRSVSNDIKEYFGMTEEGFTLEAFLSSSMRMVKTSPKWLKENDIAKAYTEWEVISEEDFTAFYEQILLSMTLEKEPHAEPIDDIKGINI